MMVNFSFQPIASFFCVLVHQNPKNLNYISLTGFKNYSLKANIVSFYSSMTNIGYEVQVLEK